MTNPFAQFDAPEQETSNPFSQFDTPQDTKPTSQELALQTPKPAQPEREDRGLAKDLWSMYGMGSGQLLSGAGWLFGSDTLSRLGERTTQFWEQKLSQAQADANEKRFIGEDYSLGDAVNDPRSWAGVIVQSLPMMAPGIGAAGVSARTATALGAGAKTAATTATVVGSAAEGVTIGAMVGDETYKAVLNADPAMIETSPYYQDLVSAGFTDAEARKSLAVKASEAAALPAGVGGAILGAAFNKFVGDAVVGNLTKRMSLEAGKGAALEGTTEVLQGGLEAGMSQYAKNEYAEIPYDPSDALNEMVAGGAAGMTMGGTVGALGAINGGQAEPQMLEGQSNEGVEEARQSAIDSVIDENGRIRGTEPEQAEPPILQPMAPEVEAESEVSENPFAQFDESNIPTVTERVDGESAPQESNEAEQEETEAAEPETNETGIYRVKTANVKVDPEQYQFRTKVNKDGVDNRLEGVQEWDDRRAGVVTIHRRLNGDMYVADGHHRIDLANRLNQESLNARYLDEKDGWTVEEVRMEAAMDNIANDKAEPLDVAKVIRNSGLDAKDVREKNNLPNSQIIRDGQSLAQLNENVFGLVVNSQLSEKDGAAIGEAFEGGKQEVAAEIFQKVQPDTAYKRQLLVNEINAAEFVESQGEQGGLFGDDPQEVSLMQDRLKVLDSLRKQLNTDKRLFKSLNNNADRASEAGNKIAKDANEEITKQSQASLDLISRVATTPALNEMVNKAAKKVHDGESLSSVSKELKQELRTYERQETDELGQNSAVQQHNEGSEQTDSAGNERGASEPVSEIDANGTDSERQPSSRTENNEQVKDEQAPLLSSYTEEELQQKEDERKATLEAEEAAQAKEKADAQVDDFQLTGSDRQADENPNQGDIFAESQESPNDINTEARTWATNKVPRLLKKEPDVSNDLMKQWTQKGSLPAWLRGDGFTKLKEAADFVTDQGTRVKLHFDIDSNNDSEKRLVIYVKKDVKGGETVIGASFKAQYSEFKVDEEGPLYHEDFEIYDSTVEAFEETEKVSEPDNRFEAEEDWGYEFVNFPEPEESISHLRNETYISDEDARKKLKEWKSEAKRIGETEDHSREVVISLFDESGELTKPWREAGYHVIQRDLKLGNDIMSDSPLALKDEIEEALGEDYRVVALFGQPPCTCFTNSNTRWRKERHDKHDRQIVEQMFGPNAAMMFSKPKEFTKAMASVVDLYAEIYDPDTTLMENPSGRIAKELGLPKPTLKIHPHNYGDPYTKETHLWGKFNPDLPLANVFPDEGSRMHKLWSDAEKDQGLRSKTPEGFAYAFFMANKTQAPSKAQLEVKQETIEQAKANQEPEEITIDSFSPNSTLDDIEALIDQSEAELSVVDKSNIRLKLEEFKEHYNKAAQISGAGSHLDGVQKHYHLGMTGGSGRNVGKLNKRREKAMDKSVENAGKAVELYNRGDAAKQVAKKLLEGKGTEADLQRKAEKKEQLKIEAGERINSLKKGDTISGQTVLRVNHDKEGYPISFSYKGDYSWNEKIEFDRVFFDNSREELKKYVDLARSKQIESAPESDAKPYVAQYDELWSRIDEADETVTVEEITSFITQLKENEDAAKAELGKMTKAQLVKYYNGYRDSGMKKDQLVRSVFKDIATSFKFLTTTSEMMVISGTGISDPIASTLEELKKLSNEKLQENMQARKARREERISEYKKKIDGIKDPKTLDDFRNVIRTNNADKLNPEQWATYDRLHADERLEKQAQSRVKTVESVSGDVNYSLHETVHSQKGIDLFVVSLADRVGSDLYRELNAKAKQLGGYYSRYSKDGAIPGFQFKSKEARSDFLKVLEGDSVEKEKQYTDKTESLLDLAARIEERAKGALNQDRKTNTARRASMAAGAVANAEYELYEAAEIRTIAEAIRDGKAKYLSRLSAGTELDAIRGEWNSLIHLAQYSEEGKALREQNIVGGEARGMKWKDGVTPEQKVRFAEYPLMRVHRDTLKRTAEEMSNTKGFSLAGKQLLKLTNTQENKVYIADSKHFDKFKEFALKRLDHSYLEEVARDYNRMQKMGIETLPMLRAALLEYYELSSNAQATEVKSATSEKLKYADFMGKYKENDFFNTTQEPAQQVVELADLSEGMTVLEPSAGLGHLADAAAEIVGKDNVTTNELSYEMSNFLKDNGYTGTNGDFLELDSKPIYDRVIMNPPFSKDQEITHIEHAYKFVKPGGKLVAITSSMAGERSNKRNQAFKEWLDDLAADQYPLPKDSFKEAINPTGVNTKIIVIDKPETASARFSLAPANSDALPRSNRTAVSQLDADKVISRITRSWRRGREDVRLVNSFSELPSDIQEDAYAQGASENDVRGVFQHGKLYVVRENHSNTSDLETTIFHEAYGHYGLRSLFGQNIETKLNALFMAIGGSTGLNKMAHKYGIDLTEYAKGLILSDYKFPREVRNAIMVEELLAHMAENQKPSILKKLKEFVGAVRNWLRENNFLELSKYTDSDLFYLLKQSKNAVRESTQDVGGDTRFVINENLPAFRRNGDEEPSERSERWRKFFDGISHQPIDRMFRLPFDVAGLVDSHGRLKASTKINEKAAHIIKEWTPHNKDQFNWMDNTLEVARHGLIDRYKLTDEYKTKFREAEAMGRSIDMQALDILKKLEQNGVSGAEAAVLHKMLTGEKIENRHLNSLAAPILRAIDDLGLMAVEYGVITREQFERNRGEYLHRSYLKHEGAFTGIGKWIMDRQVRHARKIQGKASKGRGIEIKITMDRLLKHVPREWYGQKLTGGADLQALTGRKFIVLENPGVDPSYSENLEGIEPQEHRSIVETIYWPTDLPRPRQYEAYRERGKFEVRRKEKGKAVLWRDYTKAEREHMGEIIDARYNIAKTFQVISNDIAMGKFFHDVAQNDEWFVRDLPPNVKALSASEARSLRNLSKTDWVHVPESIVSHSAGTKQWGALSGGYVRSEIWRDLTELDKMNNPGMWRKVLTQWKLNKTARSPVVHMNNVMSNVMLMDLADVRMTDLSAGIKSYVKNDEHRRAAEEHGAFEGTFANEELRRRVMEPILEDLAKQSIDATPTTENMLVQLDKILARVWSKIKTIDGAMTEMYQVEDELFRMATYMRRISLGDSPQDAARIAREQFLDYDIRAPWINAARRTVLPFISYTYRAVPVLFKAITERPWKLAKYVTLAHVAMALAYSIEPGDEDEEYRTMRDDQQGLTWMGTPRMMRLPERDEHGNPMFIDVRRWIPAGDVFDMNQGNSAIPIPAPVQFGGPLMIAAEFALNKQAFTGKEIVSRDTDTLGEAASKTASWFYKSWMPSAAYIPGSYYWEKMQTAWDGGRDILGRPYNFSQAMLSSIGIKVQPHDIKLGYTFRSRDLASQARLIKGDVRRAQMDLDRDIISKAEYNKIITSSRKKLVLLSEKQKELQGR